jgi:GTPase SAR1 family protein
MDSIIKALFDENGRIKPGSKRIVVTGIGGCGKTQLVRKFVEDNRDQ